MTAQISIRGARLHNLKNIDLDIPKNQLVVLTGLSGSGKSTLGFDILHKEGQRQYLESLGLVTFGLAKPPVDSITGLSPSISLDQGLTNQSPRSTVGTATEVYTYLRVLYARLGHRPCPACNMDIPPAVGIDLEDWEGDTKGDGDLDSPEGAFPCPHCGAPVPEINMANFSFNKPLGACPTCTGLGYVQDADLGRLVDMELSLAGGAVLGWNPQLIQYHTQTLQAAARHHGFQFDPSKPLKDYTPTERDLLFYGVESPRFQRHFPQVEPPSTVRQGRFEGLATALLRRYAEHIHEPAYREKMDQFLVTQTCPDCEGNRLRPESRLVTVNDQPIVALSPLPLDALAYWLKALPAALSPDENLVAAPVLDDLGARLDRLIQVGVGYLTLERSTPSLSAGEAQRLRLASLVGSGLTGVLYVLDEPTIGLHPRDTGRLIQVLRRLRDLDNTVLVIEHDLEMIRSADYVIDMGPGGGKRGGQVVAVGTPGEVSRQSGTLTGDYLAGRASVPIPKPRRSPSDRALTIFGARQNNLQNLTVSLPLGVLIAVSGVSGAGKSSLIFDILDRAGRKRFYSASDQVGNHDAIRGWENIDKIVTIGQEPIRRIPRSNAATYSEVYTPIRETFADQPEALRRGYSARHFSFNVPGGRCARCEGAGLLMINMHFLPDVEVRCPACHGRRFNPETLAVKYRQHDIAQVLRLTIEEALDLFQDVTAAASRLKVMSDVGLGYLQLGQPATTLSGGEAQRIKLAKELGRRSTGRTLYLLDEPTIGLHAADTLRLLSVLQRLVDLGNSVLIVEHNLDVIKSADWVIDLGPEGGASGGQIVAQGTPEQIVLNPASHTGQFLRELI
jgi:excinuclease ABC subunit A